MGSTNALNLMGKKGDVKPSRRNATDMVAYFEKLLIVTIF